MENILALREKRLGLDFERECEQHEEQNYDQQAIKTMQFERQKYG